MPTNGTRTDQLDSDQLRLQPKGIEVPLVGIQDWPEDVYPTAKRVQLVPRTQGR